MTVHHVIALVLSVMLIMFCIAFGQHCGAHMKDILYFAGMIASSTFAHAQGQKTAKKLKPKKKPEAAPDGSR